MVTTTGFDPVSAGSNPAASANAEAGENSRATLQRDCPADRGD